MGLSVLPCIISNVCNLIKERDIGRTNFNFIIEYYRSSLPLLLHPAHDIVDVDRCALRFLNPLDA